MTNITHLLECDFETFKTEYDQRRNDIMVEAAYTMARKLDGPIEEMDQNTATQLIAGERAVSCRNSKEELSFVALDGRDGRR